MSILLATEQTEMIKVAIDSHLVFIGLNKRLVESETATTELQKQLDILNALDKEVYFLIEERCEWQKQPFIFHTVLPSNQQPVDTQEGLDSLLTDLDTIVGNLSSYLEPVEVSDTQEKKYRSLIEEAKNTNELNLDKLNLTEVSDFVFEMTHLKRLSIADNNLSELPTSIGKLNNLEELVLSGNELINRLPNELTALHRLQKLLVDHTCINAFPEGLGSMKRLKHISALNTQVEVLTWDLVIDLHLDALLLTNELLLNVPFFRKTSFLDEARTYFRSLRSNNHHYLSVLEIHSEFAKPRYEQLFNKDGDKVSYEFFSNVNKPVDLFRIISQTVAEKIRLSIYAMKRIYSLLHLADSVPNPQL